MFKNKVVLVSFPFEEHSIFKIRPALCLTDSMSVHKHVVLAFITSKPPTEILETDLIIDLKDDDFKTTGLHMTSTIRLHRLTTISVNSIRRELGNITPKIEFQVNNKLSALFNIKPI